MVNIRGHLSAMLATTIAAERDIGYLGKHRGWIDAQGDSTWR
ncbi:hypothetical protein [Mesorhizobium sp.]|nr:hypothetical protein [Mesorhizobium sp.]